MANFSQLQTDVASLVAKSNLTGALPLLTRLAQDNLSRKYTPRFLYRVSNIALTADTFTLPADLHIIHTIRLWDTAGVSGALIEVPEVTGRAYLGIGGASTPTTPMASTLHYWREMSGLCRLAFVPPTGAFLELDYAIKDVYLTNPTDVNLWLTGAYDVLLLEVCAQAMLYINDEQRMQIYHGQALDGLKTLQHNDVANEVSGRDILIKGGYDA